MQRILKGVAALGIAGSGALTNCNCFITDPMPPPINCGEDLTGEYLLGFVYPSARWISAKPDNTALLFTLYAGPDNPTFAADPTVQGASVLLMDHDAGDLFLTLSPAAGVTSIQLSIPMGCEDKSTTLNLVLDVNGTPELDGYIPVSLAGG